MDRNRNGIDDSAELALYDNSPNAMDFHVMQTQRMQPPAPQTIYDPSFNQRPQVWVNRASRQRQINLYNYHPDYEWSGAHYLVGAVAYPFRHPKHAIATACAVVGAAVLGSWALNGLIFGRINAAYTGPAAFAPQSRQASIWDAGQNMAPYQGMVQVNYQQRGGR